MTEIVEGNPHEEIPDYASEYGIDMVIMGTHGRTGLDRAVMRSVAERVVRRSPVPVLTVRAKRSTEVLSLFDLLLLFASFGG
ncbi:universal stress protein [Halopelagius inordinatus]|uniref:universal stress protein n=1 Tax=Halopelagius inordinatus TaxID=553467 RepID=UPI001FE6D5BB|nr:universal stress protein [Halopelagius inordinatus]